MSLVLCLSFLFQLVIFHLTTTMKNRALNTDKNALHEHLFHYETLRKSDMAVHARQQRDGDTAHITLKTHVSFFALGRNFNLVLKAGSPVLGQGFKAYTVDKDGMQTVLRIDPNNFFTGHLQENESIPVDAYYEDGLLCTTVHFPNETYFTEPSWRHLPRSSLYDLISYRLSDVNWSSIGPFHPPLSLRSLLFSNSSGLAEEQYTTIVQGKHRRESFEKKICPLKLVADYLFYSKHSQRSAEGAAWTMVTAIQLANRIFRNTKWNLPDGLGWGFVIKELLVHTEYSSGPPDGVYSYNYERRIWTASSLIDHFSISKDNQKVCIAYLFTSYSFQFDDGYVGYAYVGNKDTNGGICSSQLFSDEIKVAVFRRTAWSTTISARGLYLLRAHHELVTSHELGHTWGSAHDRSGRCIPSDQQGGLYIMYPSTPLGKLPNNYRFSQCTIDDVSQVLVFASHKCFTEEANNENTCGNGILDGKEECDAGVNGLLGKDQCCTKTCTMQTSARCSDLNSPCCRGCSVASAGTVCEASSDVRCLQASYCDGSNFTCPPSQLTPDGSACLDGGTCKRGKCVPYCEKLGESLNLKYASCMCQQNAIAACMRCCMEVLGNNTNGPCLPTNQSLGPGRHCFNGECDDNGVCVPSETGDMIKLFTFFSNRDFHYFAEQMKTNMVTVVIFLSALIWILASCYISKKDKIYPKKLSEQEERDTAFLVIVKATEDVPSENNENGDNDGTETIQSQDDNCTEEAIEDVPSKNNENGYNDGLK